MLKALAGTILNSSIVVASNSVFVSKVRTMASVVPSALLNQLQATNGKTITCKAAVAWKAKQPLDITDIQVNWILDR
jgi:hypothetical protein